MSNPPIRRILMISTHGYVSAKPELGKPDTGGQVAYVIELSKALAKRGFHVEILTRQFEDQSSDEFVAPSVQLRRFPCGGQGFIAKEQLCEHLDEWIANVLAYLHSTAERVDLIVSHYWDAGLAGMKLSRQTGIRHIHVPHSLGAWKQKSIRQEDSKYDLNYDVRIASERQIYESSSMIIATSKEQAWHLDELYGVGPHQIRQMAAGYCPDRFSARSQQSRASLKKRYEMEAPTILALGRIAANKGYDLLIQSMPAVLARVPKAQLVLAIGATEPTPNEVQEISALRKLAASFGVLERTSFRSYVPDEELSDYYGAADVFVLSSSYEPFGMTAIEAMACGTPTVITTRGGLWEELRWGIHTLYVDPFDSEAMGHCISTVLSDNRLAEQLSTNALRLVRDRFCWSSIASEFEKQAMGSRSMFSREPSLWARAYDRSSL